MNSQRLTHGVALATLHAYRWLLTLYPANFRSNYGLLMIQAYRDQTRDAQAHNGLFGLMSLWLDTIKDLVSSICKEQFDAWRRDMRPTIKIVHLIGSIFLVISGLFVIVNVLQYEIGVDLAWNPFEKLLDATRGTPLSIIFDAVIILGPALAVGLFILPYVEFRWKSGEDEIAAIVIHKIGTPSLVLIGLCVLVLGIMGLYLIGENLPCLIGQQVSC